MTGWLLLITWLILVFAAIMLARRLLRIEYVRKRLFMPDSQELLPIAPDSDHLGFLRRWLLHAGYRSPGAAYAFIALTAALLCLGAIVAWWLGNSGLIARAVTSIGAFPGGALDILAPIVMALPWIILIFLALLPFLIVRSARKRRVAAVEYDLPITLEILSALAEAGLSFDPALDRVLESQPVDRPLATELRLFRDEVRTGRPRVQSFRRLARRLEMTAISIFVSALVQAEQSGAGVAAVLRQQADDMRHRRRERALEMASALPVKRLVPLFVCFLPGIFIWALGPSFFQLVRFLDLFSRNRGLH